MAKKISQLTQATQVKSDDVTVIVQDGETKKLPLNMMVTKQDIEDKKVAGLAKLDEIEATYENDTYTPTITVKNKSSVKVGEGDGVDYSANVMDGPAKSAILTGQTLVNISIIKEYSFSSTQKQIKCYNNEMIKTNTEYTIIYDITDTNNLGSVMLDFFGNTPLPITLGRHKIKYTTLTSLKNNSNMYISGGFVGVVDNIMIIEGDYINVDIPYFTGMQSVKLPVLTTTGKNLYSFGDVSFTSAYTSWHDTLGGNNMYGSYVPKSKAKFMLKAGKYTLSFGEANNFKTLQLITMDEKIIRNGVGSFELTDDTYVVLRGIVSTSNEISSLKNIQIEQDTQATTYEPFKSNILSTSEEVVLRRIGDVQDTLNCLTGVVTERIGEIVLDGSENWDADGNLYFTSINKKVLNNEAISNYLQRQGFVDFFGNSELIGVSCQDLGAYSRIYIRINANYSKEETIQYLQRNPLTVQYALATESVKTVDLIPSGTHPSTTPYCWKDGHIQLSSSGLLPSLEYSVVTSRAGQISQNAAMIVKNDKRIFDLEILLAGGLVNTTYQALTLQNQVETGLSKVSLSSEKEPDYLLYHMIMKLIEEKAYKLDDLAEKVSVFYLYEKLSDEQFETIYSELYPFVEEEYIELPEDGEIIEEPIVDEVLEEVENGVVM